MSTQPSMLWAGKCLPLQAPARSCPLLPGRTGTGAVHTTMTQGKGRGTSQDGMSCSMLTIPAPTGWCLRGATQVGTQG